MTEYIILMPLLILVFGLTPIVARDSYLNKNQKYIMLWIIGLIGVLIAQLPALIGNAQLDPVWTATIVAASMAVLSPIMAALGEADEKREGEHAKEDLDEYQG